MKLSREYPSLFEFLKMFSSVGLLDEGYETEEEFIEDTFDYDANFEKEIAEGRLILANSIKIFREISEITGLMFRNNEEARAWLSNIIDLIEKKTTK